MTPRVAAFSGPGAAAPGLARLSAAEAVGRMRRGELTAERYVGALLEFGREFVHLNSFIFLDDEAALAAARSADSRRASGEPPGPLHGLPLAIKDNIETEGLPASAGTRALAAMRSRGDAAVVALLKRAGALVLGKTNLHELSMGWTGNNPHFGPALNPRDPARIAGGSSGGTAAAVAAGLAPAGLGTDTNGSLRIPAGFCGIASFRPTTRRYPAAGVVPLSFTLDTVGPMARNTRDLALLDAVMADRPAGRPLDRLAGVRIGIVRDAHFSRLEPAVAAATEEALVRLRKGGAILVEVEMPGLDDLLARIAYPVIHYEAARLLPVWLETACDRQGGATGPLRLADVARSAGPDVRRIIETVLMEDGADRITERRYADALVARAQLRALVGNCFPEHGLSLIALPVTRILPPKAEPVFVSPAPDVTTALGPMSAREAYGRNIALASAAGLPALVLPAARSPEGLPVGIEFDGPEGADEAVLAMGHALENALGFDHGM